jgi:hypothetical protein
MKEDTSTWTVSFCKEEIAYTKKAIKQKEKYLLNLNKKYKKLKRPQPKGLSYFILQAEQDLSMLQSRLKNILPTGAFNE